MAKRTTNKKAGEKQGDGRFKKGDDPRRNVTGANKGSKWTNKLLRKMMDMPIKESSIKKSKTYRAFLERFPEYFNGDAEMNFALFMEVRQMSLVLDKDPKVAQAAIKEIKDRLEGKSVTTLDLKGRLQVENKDDLSKLTEKERDEWLKIKLKMNA